MFKETQMKTIHNWLKSEGFFESDQPTEEKGGQEPERELIQKLLETYTMDITDGYKTVLQTLAKRGKGGALLEEYRISSALIDELAEPRKSMDLWSENIVMQGLLGYTGQQMGEMYQMARDLYHNKEAERARKVCLFLLYLHPYIPWFWQLLGRCWQLQGDTAYASYAYSVAINLEPRSLDLYKDIVSCLIEQEEWDHAESVVQYGLDRLQLHEGEEELQQLEKALRGMSKAITQERKG